MGIIDQYQTTTKHNKAQTMYIFRGMYSLLIGKSVFKTSMFSCETKSKIKELNIYTRDPSHIYQGDIIFGLIHNFTKFWQQTFAQIMTAEGPFTNRD